MFIVIVQAWFRVWKRANRRFASLLGYPCRRDISAVNKVQIRLRLLSRKIEISAENPPKSKNVQGAVLLRLWTALSKSIY